MRGRGGEGGREEETDSLSESGTDLAYDATRYVVPTHHMVRRDMRFHVRAEPGGGEAATEAMPGTDIAYGAMQCAVPT
eukprot:2769850-Rhodomonas_salina.1